MLKVWDRASKPGQRSEAPHRLPTKTHALKGRGFSRAGKTFVSNAALAAERKHLGLSSV
jgi:hypothetical protein